VIDAGIACRRGDETDNARADCRAGFFMRVARRVAAAPIIPVVSIRI
jgi:hypothetical protein